MLFTHKKKITLKISAVLSKYYFECLFFKNSKASCELRGGSIILSLLIHVNELIKSKFKSLGIYLKRLHSIPGSGM